MQTPEGPQRPVQDLLAGAARVDFTPDPERGPIELMGYGARRGHASRVEMPVHARALALAPAEAPERGSLWISAEVCLMGPEQAREVQGQVAEATGLPAERVLVAATHTHSAPDTGLAAANGNAELPAWVPGLFGGMVDAAVTAWRELRPARAAWHRTEARIGRNRRLEDGPRDPLVSVLHVTEPGGAPIATAYHHACHGTVLGHDNLEISGDWPGAASRRIEAELGGVAPFLLGAHADIDPRTRGLMDLCIPGQSVGLSHAAVEVLGDEVAGAVIAAVRESAGREVADLDVRCARLTLPVHLGDLSADEARAALGARKRELARLLDLEVDAMPRLARLWDLATEKAAGLPVAEARQRIATVRLYVRDKTAPFFVGNRRQVELALSLLRLGDVVLLALPLEPTTNVGLDWAERAARHGLDGRVIGIANGWLRYLPHARDLAHPLAHQHYEVLSSVLADDACARILDAAEAELVEVARPV